MTTTKNTTQFYGCRVFCRDTVNSNPAYRVLHVESSTKVLERERIGDINPNFKHKINTGAGATTQLDGIFNSLEGHRSKARISFIWTPNGTGTQYREAYGDICVHSTSQVEYTSFTSNAEARASSRFLSAIRSAEVKVSGPTFLGELRQTLQMLRKPATALQDSIGRYLGDVRTRNQANRSRNYKRKPRQYARELSKIAAGSWLEYSFGWVPLLYDINGAKEAYDDLFEIDRHVRISGGGHDSKLIASSTVSNPLTLGGAGIFFLRNQKIISHETIRYRGGVRAQAATTAWDRAARFGFTPSEFIPTAWELLPWSFLVDYFVNIGDIINAAVVDRTNVTWVNRSWVKKAEKIQSCDIDRNWLKVTFVTPNTLLSVDSSPGFSRWRKSIVNRSVGNVNAIWPTLTFSYPGSNTRLLNCAALLAQVGLTLHPQKPSKRSYRL